jgi:spermidine synthase
METTDPMTPVRESSAPRPQATSTLALMFTVFFLSGMAGLIYQVVWSRLLTLVIGVSIFAITTVICTFMVGLALGSYLLGRWGDRFRDPLLAYGVIEGVIGVYAALTPWIFQGAQPVYAWAFTSFDRFGLNVVRILLSMLILLLPTALMGGTLPLLARAIAAWSGRTATGAGLLYAVNTFGAVAGCALAGFVLLAQTGVRGSLFIAAAMNLGIAAVVVLARRGAAPLVPAPETEAPAGTAAPEEAPRRAAARFVLAVFFVSGFAALGYEVLWTRALLVYLKSSTYAFSLMLSIYLLGVAAGSALAAPIAGRVRRPLLGVAACQLGVAATVVAGMLAFPHLDDWGLAVIGSRRIETFGRALALMTSQAAMVLLLPTVFMGAMFPFGIAAYHERARGVSRSVGSLYAVNTAGNIAGAVVVGFAAISVLGVRHSMILLVAVNLLVAAVVLARESRRGPVAILWPAAAVAAALAVHLQVSARLFYDSITAPGNRIVYYREGASDTVAVVERPKIKDLTLLYSDGRGAAGTQTLPWNLYFGHLPMLFHPSPREVLHICYGTGNSVLALTRHDPERVDVVELSPHVREASQYFWTNEGVLDDRRVNLIIEDGRNFLLGTDRRYDVISLEPPNIFTAGVVNLYSKEFYDLALKRLKPGGMMVQWLPTIQLSEDDRGMLIRAFADAFPYVSIWQQLRTTSLLLLGSDRPVWLDADEIDRRLRATPDMERDLKSMNVRNAYGFLSFYLLGDPSTRKLVEPYRPVRDDLTVVDYSIPRFAGSGFGFSLFTYVVGDETLNPSMIMNRRLEEYASWGDPAATIVRDPCQAKRLDLAIRYRMEGLRPGFTAAVASIPGCPTPALSNDSR